MCALSGSHRIPASQGRIVGYAALPSNDMNLTPFQLTELHTLPVARESLTA
jgi:hypothetical protein